jgi:hypothetical protein
MLNLSGGCIYAQWIDVDYTIKDKSNCDSPLRRSAGSVDSLIGQVRAIFRDYGRGSEWNDTLGLGNPAAVPIVKRYLAAIRLIVSTLQ